MKSPLYIKLTLILCILVYCPYFIITLYSYINQHFLDPDPFYFYPMTLKEFVFSWILGFYLIYSGAQFLMGRETNKPLQLFFIGAIIERLINWKFNPAVDQTFVLFTLIPIGLSIIGFIIFRNNDHPNEDFSEILDKN